MPAHPSYVNETLTPSLPTREVGYVSSMMGNQAVHTTPIPWQPVPMEQFTTMLNLFHSAGLLNTSHPIFANGSTDQQIFGDSTGDLLNMFYPQPDSSAETVNP
jgi:hypothetical protein